MEALQRQPDGVFLGIELADRLDVEPGDDVQVLFARATKEQQLSEMKVIGLFERVPGFPEGVDLAGQHPTSDAAHPLDECHLLPGADHRPERCHP